MELIHVTLTREFIHHFDGERPNLAFDFQGKGMRAIAFGALAGFGTL